jgi:hypothetical protein
VLREARKRSVDKCIVRLLRASLLLTLCTCTSASHSTVKDIVAEVKHESLANTIGKTYDANQRMNQRVNGLCDELLAVSLTMGQVRQVTESTHDRELHSAEQVSLLASIVYSILDVPACCTVYGMRAYCQLPNSMTDRIVTASYLVRRSGHVYGYTGACKFA